MGFITSLLDKLGYVQKDKTTIMFDANQSSTDVISHGIDFKNFVKFARRSDIVSACFPAGQKVHLNCSWKNIEDMQVGDSVVTHLGNISNVTKTMARDYAGSMVRITLDGLLFPIDCTPEHPILVIKPKQKNNKTFIFWPQWVEASQIETGDYLLYRINTAVSPLASLKISDSLAFNVESEADKISCSDDKARWVKNELFLDADFLRLMGSFAARGSVSIDNGYQVSFKFHENERVYIDDIKRQMSKYFGVEGIEQYSPSRIVFLSKILAYWFGAQFGYKASERILPSWLMLLPPKLQIEFLRGYLMQEHGCYGNNPICCITSSEQFCLQVRELILRQGFVPCISKRDDTKVPTYVLSLGSDEFLALLGHEEVSFKEQSFKTSSSFFVNEDYAFFPVKTVEDYFFIGKVYNLSVAGDESYTVSGCSVHNCEFAILDYARNVPWDIKHIIKGKKPITAKVQRVKKLLLNPNRNGESFQSLCRKVMQDILTIDAGAIEIVRNGFNEPAELWAVDGTTLYLKTDERGIEQYFVQRTSKGDIKIPREDIMYFQQAPTSRSVYGQSKLEVLMAVVAVDLYVQNYQGLYFQDNVIPSGLLDLGAVGKSEAKRIREWLRKHHKGQPHKLLVMNSQRDQKINYIPFKHSLKDMALVEVQKELAKRVMAVYGVTENELGWSENVNRATGFNLSFTFKQRALKPLLTLVADVITKELIWEEFGYDELIFEWGDIDQRDATVVSNIADKSVKTGLYTPNELRALQGLESYKGFGDEPIIISGGVPILLREVEERYRRGELANRPRTKQFDEGGD